MESSSYNKNQEMSAFFLGNQNDTLPNYAELQNVLPATADTNDTNITYNEGIPVATISRQCSSDNVSTEMTIERPTEAPIEPEVQDIGHRIIDVNYFITELVKFSEHKSLFNCGLGTLKLESEHHVGLQSEFTYVCSLCGYKNKIKSSLADVKKDAVAGVMAAGCGQAQLNQFLSGVGLPNKSDFTYNKMHNDICDDWEETAWDEMKKAGEREKEAAIKEGRFNKDGIPLVDVIVDGWWYEKFPFLDATPDGITTSDMIVEIKCPIAPFKNGIEDAIQIKKMHFYKNKNDEVVINQRSDWYFQIQGQLHI
nr:uncharacterized protein LOC113403659 [Vanessa tameamea]